MSIMAQNYEATYFVQKNVLIECKKKKAEKTSSKFRNSLAANYFWNDGPRWDEYFKCKVYSGGRYGMLFREIISGTKLILQIRKFCCLSSAHNLIMVDDLLIGSYYSQSSTTILRLRATLLMLGNRLFIHDSLRLWIMRAQCYPK